MGKVAAHKQYVIDDHGKKTAVIIPMEEYEDLMEDLHDLAVAVERRDEPVAGFEELKKELKSR
ncbi:MAG: type II toxin-antitoxin system Phd/YefM family antitoxin [Spirochaetaceae bacterium]|nr:MAG: type II toxin-antitoxin system Phd/YefM family antitoxin [Spirochaetaceae bacterium]